MTTFHSFKLFSFLLLFLFFAKLVSDVCSHLSDNRIESLIQKADQVLNSLSRSSGQAESPADPGKTRIHSKEQEVFYTE